MKLSELVELLEGAGLKGDPHSEILDLGLPGYAGDRLLTYVTNQRYLLKAIRNPDIAAILVEEGLDIKDSEGKAIVSCRNAKDQFFKIHKHLLSATNFYGEPFSSEIHKDTSISSNAYIAEKNVIIGEGVEIMPGAVILENSVLMPHVKIGPNTVIGFEGTQIGYEEDIPQRIPHAGGVIIKNNSFVGANSVIIKSLFKHPTIIEENVTIGNLVNIGHGCRIEQNVMILPHSIISGSTVIGKGSRVSPGSVVSSSVKVGKNVNIKIGSVVVEDVEEGKSLSGNFAIEHEKNLKRYIQGKKK